MAYLVDGRRLLIDVMTPTTTKEVPWVDAAIRYTHLQPNNNDDSTADEEEEAEEDDLPPPTESYTFSIPTQTTTMMDVIILI